MIAAILRAQWLSMRFNSRGRIATLLVACIWYGMWTLGAWAAAVGIAAADAAALRLYLPVGLAGVFLYWQLMPVISAKAFASVRDSYSCVVIVSDTTLISMPLNGAAAFSNHCSSFI